MQYIKAFGLLPQNTKTVQNREEGEHEAERGGVTLRCNVNFECNKWTCDSSTKSRGKQGVEIKKKEIKSVQILRNKQYVT